MKDSSVCNHINRIEVLKYPQKQICEECIKTGNTWVHLRTCQTCGITLCCDDSSNKHMTKHFSETNHPVVISAEPGEKWIWCYQDKLFVEYD